MRLLCRRYVFDGDQVDEEEELDTAETFNRSLVYNFIGIFMTEVILSFIYIIAALILTYMLNIGPITQLRINRWIIEGFYAPSSILIIWYLYHVYDSGQHIYDYNPTSYAKFTSIVKLFIFLFVRYMEIYPSSRLHNRAIALFHRYCNSYNKYYTDKNDFLQSFLNANKTSFV